MPKMETRKIVDFENQYTKYNYYNTKNTIH